MEARTLNLSRVGSNPIGGTMKKKVIYDLELLNNDIFINAEIYKGGVFALPHNEDYVWSTKEKRLLSVSEYERKKKVEQRKKKIEKIKKNDKKGDK